MSLRNSGVMNVRDGDTATKFVVSTKPARESAQRDKDNPRSSLIQNGNYVLTCRSARYITERKTRNETVKLPFPRIAAVWEGSHNGQSLGSFRCEHTLPVQAKDGDKFEGSEKFWSNMRRSFADFEGEKALAEYLERDEVSISPEWLVGKSGYAHLEVERSQSGKGQYTNIKYFMGKTEYTAAPGPAAGDASVPPKTEGAPEVAGGDDSTFNGGGYDDSDVPF